MIKNFNLSPNNFHNFVAKLKLLDLSKGYVANITEKKTKRSLEQNNLYWEYVDEFGKNFGYDKDFTHDLLRFKFLYEVINIDGEEHKRLLSTTKLDTKSMSEYFEKCLRYGSENGFYFET